MSSDLFRKEALSRYLRTDAPGGLITITPPWAVAMFATMALLVVGLGLLAFFAHVQLAASGRGVVRPNQPAIVLRAPFAGTVLSVARGVRDRGRRGELFVALDARSETAALERCAAEFGVERAELASLDARLAEWNQSTDRERDAAMALVLLSQLRSQREKTTTMAQRCDALSSTVARSRVELPVDVVVSDLAVAAGARVREGDVLATLIPARATLVGYLALGERHRSELSVGQPVRVEFDALPSDEVGTGSARVARILDALPSGVKIEGADGASVFAELSLDTMPEGVGPPREGMTFAADVLTRRRRALSLLFGASGGP